jgi:hypothetical protein
MNLCQITGKRKYSTEKEANRARIVLWGKDPSVDLSDLRYYICPACGKYHIGHYSFYLKHLGSFQVEIQYAEEGMQGEQKTI